MQRILFNDNWYFCSDIDARQIRVRLPHDAMQTEKRIPGLKGGTGTGYYPGGIYTYVKTLDVSREDLEKTMILEFEGVYMKSSVYLNGEQVGGHIYGYTDFYVDLTGKLKEGPNEIRVIADNSQFANSRWYSGSGIYRDVVLHTAGAAYIKPDGIKVETLSIDPVRINIHSDTVKSENVSVRNTVYFSGNQVVQAEGEDLILAIPNARLWSAETPELYVLKVELLQNGQVLDTAWETFGIRSIDWSAERGFQVNGKTVNLRGGCIHHDNGFIGAAEFGVACERRVRIMKDAGFNAIRTAHNPTSRAMLRACDKLGMYVMNETFDTWLSLKSPYDYAMYFAEEWRKDVQAMIRVSYNHPSVVMYCIGNEIYFKNAEKTGKTTKEMVDFCHAQDPGRPVLNALNPSMVMMDDKRDPEQYRKEKPDPRAADTDDKMAGSRLVNFLVTIAPMLTKLVGTEKAMRKHNACMEPLDILGLNYGDHLYDAQHKDYPNRVLCGSETYPSQIGKNWAMVEAKPWVIGDFLWTAWDYLGETGIGTVSYSKQEPFSLPFPGIAAGCANIDLTGEITCQGVYTAIVYGQYNRPYIAVHPVNHAGEKVFVGRWRFTDAVHSWSWAGCDGRKAAVDVYSSDACVELFLNGTSLGRKAVKEKIARFEVAYCPGELKAVSYDAAGKETGIDILVSAGETEKLRVVPETQILAAGGADLLYLQIEITDDAGVRHVLKDREVSVTVEGAAELMGIGNAALNQVCLQPYVGNTINTYEGRALAILRSTADTGEVHITVTSEGLEPVAITLNEV